MTASNPNLFTPLGAANYDSFAGFAGTTQQQWTDLITGNMSGMDPMSGVCALMSQLPFLDGLASFGGYGDPDVGIASGLVNGIQLVLDGICGLLGGSGAIFGGTSLDTLFGALTQFVDLLFDNPLTELLVQIVDQTGFLLFDIFNGILSFINQILEVVFEIIDPQLIVDLLQTWIDFIFGLFGGFGEGNFINNIFDAISGITTGNIDGIPFFGPMIGGITEAITGLLGGGFDFLGSFFGDLLGILGNPLNMGSGNPILGALEDIPIIGPIFSIVQGIIDTILEAIEGIPFIGGTLANLLGSITGLRSTSNTAHSNASSALGSVGGLITNLISAPANVIGSLINNIVDLFGGTMANLLDGIFAGNQPLNRPAGKAGGTGGRVLMAPTANAGAGGGYQAMQVANYQNYQVGAQVDSQAATAHSGGSGGGAPAHPHATGWWW